MVTVLIIGFKIVRTIVIVHHVMTVGEFIKGLWKGGVFK